MAVGGNKGIASLLGNIQKIKDGPGLNGHVSADEEFTPISQNVTPQGGDGYEFA